MVKIQLGFGRIFNKFEVCGPFRELTVGEKEKLKLHIL